MGQKSSPYKLKIGKSTELRTFPKYDKVLPQKLYDHQSTDSSSTTSDSKIEFNNIDEKPIALDEKSIALASFPGSGK